MSERFTKLARLRTIDALRAHLDALGVTLPIDAEVDASPTAPLAQPMQAAGTTIGNRFCILPMEGWDGTTDGHPTERVLRRWRRFGESGAKLIWGGEAVAVCHEGRANPNQLLINEDTVGALGDLRQALVAEHAARYDRTDDLCVGLQLTHSGRWARPLGEPAPRVAYRHPILDARVGVDSDAAVLTDAEIERIVSRFVDAAKLAERAGFDFVDVKHCHGYLGHEFLSAIGRPGRYGGDLDGRTRFMREIVEGIRAEAPSLSMGVRLSAFDLRPFAAGEDGQGEPASAPGGGVPACFGGDAAGLSPDLAEPHLLLDQLKAMGIDLVCVTAGSPYYNPHVQRPAAFPPSDGYAPPEDPLVGVARLLAAAQALKAKHPDISFVGSGYSYLQEWLPNVAQAAVRMGWIDSVGIGRMALSYPELPADVLAGRALSKGLVCRTFSDCTTAPRLGLRSGCYPLDDFYRDTPEHEQLKERKAALQSQR